MGSREFEELSSRPLSSDIELSSSGEIREGGSGCKDLGAPSVALNRRKEVRTRWSEGLFCEVAGMDEFNREGGVIRTGRMRRGEGSQS